MAHENTKKLHERRSSAKWSSRLWRLLRPPDPLVRNRREKTDFPLGKWNLYVGGAGSSVPGFVNLDVIPLPGVDVVASVEALPFRDAVFSVTECDAVLEHIPHPAVAMREMERVMAVGGFLHLVAPFCHPFHEYPRDYWRFTLDGLKQLGRGMEVVEEGWRTGPTATLLVFLLEYAKLLCASRIWRGFAHFTLGWLLSPLRYLDLLLFRKAAAGRIANHGYVWLRKRSAREEKSPVSSNAPENSI